MFYVLRLDGRVGFVDAGFDLVRFFSDEEGLREQIGDRTPYSIVYNPFDRDENL